MNTDFFTQLSELGNFTCSLAITNNKEDNSLMVSFLPKPIGENDSAFEKLQPMNFKGTAEELNSGFFQAITEPIRSTSKMFDDSQAFIEKAKLVEAQTKKQKELKDLIKKQEDNIKPLLGSDDKIINKAEIIKARSISLLEDDPDNKVAKNAILKVKSLTSQANLF